MPRRNSGAALKRGSKRKERDDGLGSSSNQDKTKNQGTTGVHDTFAITSETSLLPSSLYRLETVPKTIAPGPSKRPRQSNSLNTPDLALNSPATSLTLKALGFTPERAKLLSKHGQKVKTFIPLSLAASKEVLDLGREATGAEFAEILIRNIEQMERENNDKQSYTGLTNEHLQRMYRANNLRYAGTVTCDTSAKLLSNVTIDPSFFMQLNILLRSTARTTEAGRRLHIGFYLMNAIDAARIYYHKSIALFSEVTIEHPDLPGIGHISGNLDFLASTVFAHVDMRYDAESALPKCPYLIIVEVKKGTTVSAITSKAQLLAELLTLQYLDRTPEGRMGVLTDGNSWDFHYIRPTDDVFELYRIAKITTDSKENIELVLGLLIHCCAGIIPKEDNTSLLHLVRKQDL